MGEEDPHRLVAGRGLRDLSRLEPGGSVDPPRGGSQRRGEVQQILRRLEGVHWLILTLLYGTGMRLLECLRLRVKDVDSSANEIVVVRDAKGGKDRVTMLPTVVQPALESQLEVAKGLHRLDLRGNVNTTMIYTHVLNRGGFAVASPADVL